MTTEGWLTWAAGLALLVAVVVQMMWLLRNAGPWRGSVWLARLAALTLLVAVLVVTALSRSRGLVLAPASLLLGLACAVLGVGMFLTWRCGVDGAGPVGDLLALALLLGTGLAWQMGLAAPVCRLHSVWFWLSWLGFLLGVGSLIEGLAAALLMVVRRVGQRLGWRLYLPPGVDLHAFPSQSAALALVSLGSGLFVAVWWAWRWTGSLTFGGPTGTWLAASWLLAAASFLSWQLARRPGRWAALFLVAAAGLGLLGSVVGPQLTPSWPLGLPG